MENQDYIKSRLILDVTGKEMQLSTLPLSEEIRSDFFKPGKSELELFFERTERLLESKIIQMTNISNSLTKKNEFKIKQLDDARQKKAKAIIKIEFFADCFNDLEFYNKTIVSLKLKGYVENIDENTLKWTFRNGKKLEVSDFVTVLIRRKHLKIENRSVIALAFKNTFQAKISESTIRHTTVDEEFVKEFENIIPIIKTK